MASLPVIGTISWGSLLVGLLAGMFLWPMIRGFIPRFGASVNVG